MPTSPFDLLPSALLAEIRAKLIAAANACRAEIVIGTLETHPWRVAMANGYALTSDGTELRIATLGEPAGRACYATKAEAARVAAEWTALHPEFPALAMTRREVAEARLMHITGLLVQVDGF